MRPGKVPPASGLVSIIERPAQLDLLDAASDTQFTVVTAPAGSGKTVLVRSWLVARRPTGRHAWVSVERGERDPQRFWNTLVTEVGRMSAVDALVDEVVAAPGFSADLAISRLVADLDALGELTLVIDDVHEIKSPDLLIQLTSFLDQLPSGTHIVLISRHDPQLGLHRRRLEGQLSEIRIDQLRFTVDESRELFAGAGINLSDHGLQLLQSRTEGWAAGLRLAAVSMANHPDPEGFVLEFSGSERTVAEYLIAEVLDSLPAEVRRLLVNTSILDRVNGALGDLLTGDTGSERHLNSLTETGGFVIALDARGEWFRFHHLFADLLATELRRAHAGEIPGLHLAAAQWLAAHGRVLEAINHALAADEHDLVAGLLVEHYFTLMLDGRQATVRSLVDAAVSRSETPELAVVLAADELLGGSLDQAAAQLALAEQRASDVPEDRRLRFEMMLYVTRLSLATRIGDFQSVLDAPQPAALYAEPLTNADLAMQTDVRALMLMNLGIVEVWSGRREDGEQHLTAAEDVARQIGRPYLEASCQAHQAQSLSWSSFTEARPVAEKALATAERHGWRDDPLTGAALVVLGSCLVATGMMREAERSFHRADETLRPDLEPAIGFQLHIGHGVVSLVKASYPEAIIHFLEAERLGRSLATSSPLALQSRCAMLYAATLAGDDTLVQNSLNDLTEAERNSGEVREVLAAMALAEGDAHAALAALSPTVVGTTEVHHRLVLIRSLLLAGRAHYLLDDDRDAIASVERALDIAEPDGLIIPFLWVGSSDLLERHPRHETSHGAFLAVVLDALSGGELDTGHRRPGTPDINLSETELRVLRFLPTNLTAAEIASEIYVSVNTVKTHMRNIYTKLDAHSRGEAVEYARELGLLSHAVRSH
jgi:LuxR family transcriptional regulator, maltose regulon positive regulatory protein